MAITYADYGSTGSNAFIGGASDHCHIANSGDPMCWALTIVRLKPTGLIESQTQIKLDSSYSYDEGEYAVIDHMHYQDDYSIAGEWLFGTTRSTVAHTSREMYVWRLDLDASHNPRADNLLVKRINDGDLKDDAKVIALNSKMYGDTIDMIFWRDNKEVVFLTFDFTQSSGSTTLLFKEVLEYPYGYFFGT